MRVKLVPKICGVLLGLLGGILVSFPSWAQSGTHTVLSPDRMPRTGTVSERFLSYNVEMREVTGGKVWRPYSPQLAATLRRKPRSTAGGGDTPVGVNPELYSYRSPINLADVRLRKLAAALGPAYLRVSGMKANAVYFSGDRTAPQKPPAGFSGVLTREQWRGVIDFARATNAEIMTSFAVSAGTRDSDGIWTAEQARRLLATTATDGGKIAAIEFMAAPTFARMNGAPASYDAATFGQDYARFHAFMRAEAPDTLILGPGALGETAAGPSLVETPPVELLRTSDLLAAMSARVDAFSYHHYGAASRRCVDFGNQSTAKAALSADWLAATDATLNYYQSLRDQFAPNAAMWLTETADAICGGNPWAATFLDTFRYLDQLGRLARQGVQVVAHNSLATSDYGLLDEATLQPRPNYWAAWLWRQLIGTTVLDPGKAIVPELHLYAHCMRDKPGGVTALLINTDRIASYPVDVPATATRYTLSAEKLQSEDVALNGRTLSLTASGDLPVIKGIPIRGELIEVEPATITFITMADADNPACR